MYILSIVVVLYSSFLLIPCSDGQHGRQQREWTQHNCQEMTRACNSLPKGPGGPRGEEGSLGSRGPSGPPGTPGQRGPRGFSPRPGPRSAQAPRGERGSLGYPGGLRGEPGKVRGPAGLKGQEGHVGLSGTQGQRGIPGSRGATGDKGLPGKSVTGWKKCTWTMDSGQGDGLLKECEFTKKNPHTSLHVIYEGSLQIGLCRRCCKRWYFTFNDVECKRPSVIDAMMSGGFQNNFPHHTNGRMEGLCEDPLQPGRVRISLRRENCRGIPGHISKPVNVNVHIPEGKILIREVSSSQ